MTDIRWVCEQVGYRTRIYRGEPRSVTFEDMLAGWSDASTLSQNFIRTLAELPFRAYLWETPPLSFAHRARRFEFAVTECPNLERPSDPAPFADPLESAEENGVACFENLGGDANLVVPAADPDSGDAAHLGSFARSASTFRQLALWQVVAQAVEDHLDRNPVWLSTSGLGVAWLHVRLDRAPKYYVHAPYRRINGAVG